MCDFGMMIQYNIESGAYGCHDDTHMNVSSYLLKSIDKIVVCRKEINLRISMCFENVGLKIIFCVLQHICFLIVSNMKKVHLQ